MTDGLEGAEERRNWLERIAAKIPGIKGYLDRELRRDVDKMQREWLAHQLDRGRGSVQEHIREWSRSGELANLDLASSLDKALDRLANRVRHADYGYTGFFDAVKIGEDDLDRLYEYDQSLREDVQACRESVAQLAEADEEALSEGMSSVEGAIEQLQDRVDRREEVVASASGDEAE